MQDLPSKEDWEREELSADEQVLAEQLAGLIELSTMAQFHMYEFFETVPPEIRGAVYAAAIDRANKGMDGMTHPAPRIVQ